MSRGKAKQPAKKAVRPVHERLEVQRRKLMRASAVLTVAALAIEHDLDRDVIADAVSAGRELVDAAVIALDLTNLLDITNPQE